jgi:hypothetical protein
MKHSLLRIGVPLLLLGAAMLMAGVGAPSLWIAVAAVGTASVIIAQVKLNAVSRR